MIAHQRTPTSQELDFVANRRIGRLATSSRLGTSSLVPFCYALIERNGEPIIVSSLDQKPKTGPVSELQRVRNISGNPSVTFLVDDYEENWERLAFVQFHGHAEIRGSNRDGFAEAIVALKAKYPQYEAMEIESRPLIWIDRLTANSWSWSGEPNGDNRSTELRSVIQARRSVRALLQDPVPRPVIERAISAAGWAPSPHGRQPWRFTVVESLAAKTKLTNAMSVSWADQLRLDGQDDSIVQIRLNKSRARLLNAPVLIVPSLFLADLDEYPDAVRQAAEETMAIQSLGAAVQNLLLSIYTDGYDAGWMCAPLFCPEIVRDALGLDESLIPHALIPVGKVAADPVRRSRRPLDELIVSWQ